MWHPIGAATSADVGRSRVILSAIECSPGGVDVVVTIFRSRIRPENETEYQVLAGKMLELARSMPGFVSYRFYSSEDGERCSIVEFESDEELQAWRDHPRHREAQRLGRERYYTEYAVCVADQLRTSAFQN
ncbi:MAG: antibiotic biosynthesis monooxygenase [bacterium]|nr:antibiotic biosynthesis monooxygenase [bacterium]